MLVKTSSGFFNGKGVGLVKDHLPFIRVEGLKKHFPLKSKHVLQAVNGVSFDVFRGETLGLAGESGCGKTTVGRTMIRLYEPTEGRVLFQGENIFTGKKMPHKIRRKMHMIFQHPYASLDPLMTVGDIIGEPMEIYRIASGRERIKRVQNLLAKVGLLPEYINRFPHELSGGQCQRVGIARALAAEPEFIICDEPISALDVSVRSQIVNLLKELQQELGLTYLFITHDLSLLKYISDRVVVMYMGRVMEMAECRELFSSPAHPYTRALLATVPTLDPGAQKKQNRFVLQGEIPSPIGSFIGCRFQARCPGTKKVCFQVEPELTDIGGGHRVSCHFPLNQKV
jgi:oligopeptide transport system ATP-binding protein